MSEITPENNNAIKFDKFFKDFVLFSVILFIYVTYFSSKPNTVNEYAERMMNMQHVENRKSSQMQTRSLQITTEEADAAIYKIKNLNVTDTAEDSAVFFNTDATHSDRIWLEVWINNVRLSNISWKLIATDNSMTIYHGIQDDIRITQKYTLENSIVSVKTIVHNAGPEAVVQIIYCTRADLEHSVQSGFKASVESGFSTYKLDLKTLENNTQHLKVDYAGIMKKYWLICMKTVKLYKTDVNNIIMFKLKDQIVIMNKITEKRVASNSSTEAAVQYYLGERDANVLQSHAKQLGINLAHSVDYGWLSWLNLLIRLFIEWLINLFGRVDVALLAFILLLRLLLLYPYLIAEKHARKIALLAAKVTRIKEIYTTDTIATEKIRALYKLHNVNEYMAKFPMFAQMFWLIPLNIMSQLFSFRGASFFGLIQDMSALDATSWTNLFGLLPWAAYNIRYINFGVWMVVFACTYLISEDIANMEKIFLFLMIFSTILIYKNFPVIFVLFWCIINLIGAVQVRLFKLFVHPTVSI